MFSCPHSPFSLSTALSPEEAESALEATHYFTEDSSSEGEHRWPLCCGLRPCRGAVVLWGPQRWAWGAYYVGEPGVTATASLWGGPPGVFSLLFLLSLPSWTLASLFLSPPLLRSPFQHLLWPQIWTFSCPGRLKVSPWGSGAPALCWAASA